MTILAYIQKGMTELLFTKINIPYQRHLIVLDVLHLGLAISRIFYVLDFHVSDFRNSVINKAIED